MAALPIPILFAILLLTPGGLGGTAVFDLGDVGDKVTKALDDFLGRMLELFSKTVEIIVSFITRTFKQVFTGLQRVAGGYFLPVAAALAAVFILMMYKLLRVIIDLIPLW